MKKLTLIVLCAFFAITTSAFVEKEAVADLDDTCTVETAAASLAYSKIYQGKVLSVGACDWVLRKCSGGMVMLDKSGVNPIVGQTYEVYVSGITNCGENVTAMYSSTCGL